MHVRVSLKRLATQPCFRLARLDCSRRVARGAKLFAFIDRLVCRSGVVGMSNNDVGEFMIYEKNERHVSEKLGKADGVR